MRRCGPFPVNPFNKEGDIIEALVGKLKFNYCSEPYRETFLCKKKIGGKRRKEVRHTRLNKMRVEVKTIAMGDSDGLLFGSWSELDERFPSIRASGQAAVVSRVSGSLLSYVLKLDILNQVKHFYLEFSSLAKLKHFPVHKTMNVGEANHREGFRS